MAGVFTVAMLASIGVPGLNGFVGEFLVLIGTFTAHRWWAVVAIMGVIVAAIYLLWAYQQVFHGEPTPSRHQDPRPRMERAAGRRPPDHPHRLPRRVPEAGARPDHPVGRPAGRPRGPGDPHPDPASARSGVGVAPAAAHAGSPVGSGSALAAAAAGDPGSAVRCPPPRPATGGHPDDLPRHPGGDRGGQLGPSRHPHAPRRLPEHPAHAHHDRRRPGADDRCRRCSARSWAWAPERWWPSPCRIAALVAALFQWDHVITHGPSVTIAGAIAFDGFDVFIQIVVSIAMLLTALVGDGYLRREGIEGPEFHVLAMMSASGAMMMGAANDLIVIFLGLEIMSIALYVLAAFNHKRAESGRGRPQVLRPRCLLLGGVRLRDRPRLRRHRIDQSAPDRRLPGQERHCLQRGAAGRIGAAAGRVRLQDRRRALPHVVARRLPGLAVPGDRVHGRGGQGRGLRRSVAGVRVVVRNACARTGSRSSGAWPSSAWWWAR